MAIDKTWSERLVWPALDPQTEPWRREACKVGLLFAGFLCLVSVVLIPLAVRCYKDYTHLKQDLLQRTATVASRTILAEPIIALAVEGELRAWCAEGGEYEQRFVAAERIRRCLDPDSQEEVLDLSKLGLTSLPNCITQCRVNKLYLAKNALECLPQSWGALTQTLTSLDLSYNPGVQNMEGIAQLTQLTTLRLAYNSLSTLPETLQALVQLTYLDLTGNMFASGIPEVVKRLSNLQQLDLNDCWLSDDHLDSLKELKQLKKLELSKNYICALPLQLQGLLQLRELSLSENTIARLPDHSLPGFPALRKLDLSHNTQLNAIPHPFLLEHAKMTIDVTGNPVSKESAEALTRHLQVVKEEGFACVKEIIFSSSLFSELPPTLQPIDPKIERSLTKWAAEHPNNARAAETLRRCIRSRALELNLRDYHVTSLPDCIGQLTHLSSLDLKGNDFHSLPLEIGQLTQLKCLQIGTPNLKALPAVIGNLSQLWVLELDTPSLLGLPDAIDGLERLETLIIKSAQRFYLPDTIGRLEHLTSLTLAAPLILLPQSIARLIHLQQLTLYRTGMEFIPNQLYALQELRELNIRGNSLQALPEALFNLPQCMSIDARDNHFDANAMIAIRNLESRVQQTRPNFHVACTPPPVLPPRRAPNVQGPPSLLETIETWKQRIPEAAQAQFRHLDFKELENAPEAEHLAIFLHRLAATKDFRDAGTNGQQVFTLRVMTMLKGMLENIPYRLVALPQAEEALNRCGDRLALGLSRLEVLWHIYIGSRGKSQLELAALAVGLERMDHIATIVREMGRRLVDPVESELYLQIHLADKLKLPVLTKTMLYFEHAGAVVGEKDAIAAQIAAATRTPEAIVDILVQREFWQDALREADDSYQTLVADVIASREYKEADGDVQKALINQALTEKYRADTQKWVEKNFAALQQLLTA